MKLIINIDDIKDDSKKEWLLRTLQLMRIHFSTKELPQTLEEYNNDLQEGDDEIERGDFITAEDLKKEVAKW